MNFEAGWPEKTLLGPYSDLRLIFLSRNRLRRVTRVRLTEVGENKVLSLNKLCGEQEGNDGDDVREGAGG